MIVFLGNPGVQHRQTRHNVGFMVCEELLKKESLHTSSWQSKFHALFLRHGDVILLKPQTFMNESGISVQEACRFFQIQPADVLAVHDDIELAFGTVKLQFGGGMGGHNGLRSIKQHLGTDQFSRLRIGVGRPPSRVDVASYILGRFTPLEENSLSGVFTAAADLALDFARRGK